VIPCAPNQPKGAINVRENPSPAASSLGKMDLSRPLVDVDVARCKVGLDREDYLELCEILLDEQDHIDAELRRARLLGPNAVIKALHELANSIAVLGVTQVATELRSLELALRDTPPPGAAEKAVDFALEIFGRICAEVRAIVQKFRGRG
jgi:HPt (histidine-containing phosphotransfer) domain-containing protein